MNLCDAVIGDDMNSSNVSKWLSFATNLAVLGGLILVAYELNQNSDLARVALINDGNVAENELWQALMDDAPNGVIAKSVECPERLTYADYVVMDSYLFTALNIIYRNYEISKECLFTQSDWKSEVEDYANWYLGDKFSRTYWDKVGKFYFDPEFSDYIDEQLAKKGIDMHRAWQLIRSNMELESTSEPLVSEPCR